MERHSTVQDLKNHQRHAKSKKDVELPLLPTGPRQDTDIVEFCVNSSCVAYDKSINPDVCELRFCLRSCCFLLLLLFDSSIYLLLCNEIYIIFNNIKLKIFVAKLYLLIIFTFAGKDAHNLCGAFWLFYLSTCQMRTEDNLSRCA